LKATTYAAAGVNIARADQAKHRIAALARATFNPQVLAEIGGFGSLFALDRKRWRDPVLVASCDGVGTKLKVAFLSNRHDTIGQDLVNHCVNDIAVQGATPLFFLDYIATGKLLPRVAAKIVSGLATACRENEMALVGGETAEMPGFYASGEYDLAGFIVGVVERNQILTGARVAAGDILLGLPSSGLHTNGYSLARHLFFEKGGYTVNSRVPGLPGKLGTALLRVHRSYLRPIRELHRRGILHGAAHITGGGFPGNLLRQVPKGLGLQVDSSCWPMPPIFPIMQELGGVSRDEMFRAFNMGIGMVLTVPFNKLPAAQTVLDKLGEKHYVIGWVVKGAHRVDYP
jgi:phosphoribosylformylglycinamidine cyclo-ligase